jgi:predicted ester cyclase
MTATHVNNYMGVKGTGKSVTLRVMDWWRASKDSLSENWGFIDMIDLFDQLGVDVFATMQRQIKS